MISIRKITEADLELVSDLFDQYREFYKQNSDIKAAQLFLADRILQKDSEIYIAEVNGNTIVGFVQLYPLLSSTRMKKLWLLNDLFVHEKYRGKGISKLLMNEAKQHCISTQACGVILETAKSNVIGNSLYPNVGFTLDNDHNYYYWDNDVDV